MSSNTIFNANTLSAGYVGSSISTLYTTPASNAAYLRDLTLTCSNVNPVQITLYKTLLSTQYQWFVFVLNQNEVCEVLNDSPLVMSAGDSIQAVCNSSTPLAVAFSVAGVLQAPSS